MLPLSAIYAYGDNACEKQLNLNGSCVDLLGLWIRTMENG